MTQFQQLASAPRVAIPVPHSGDREYAERALPQYENAVRMAGGEPVRIELNQTASEIRKQMERCDAVLLPGSRADIDPQKYNAPRHEKTAEMDAKRDAVDWVLLEGAYRARKPVLGICYGLQSLNVFRAGSLVQHIESPIQHSAGRAVEKAHMVEIFPKSRLAKVIRSDGKPIAVNSSHHQSVDVPGQGLCIAARSPVDGVVEALEGTVPGHFVLAVQWHPERSVNDGPEVAESAQAIFRAFINAAREAHAPWAKRDVDHRSVADSALHFHSWSAVVLDPSAAANQSSYFSNVLDLVDKITKICALFVGAAWAYWNYLRGRTSKRRLEPSITGKAVSRKGASLLSGVAQIKNVGLSKVTIEQKGTAIEVLALVSPSIGARGDLGEEDVRVLEVFKAHGWIEPGETIQESFLVPVPDQPEIVAFRLRLRVVSRGIEWNCDSNVDLPSDGSATKAI